MRRRTLYSKWMRIRCVKSGGRGRRRVLCAFVCVCVPRWVCGLSGLWCVDGCGCVSGGEKEDRLREGVRGTQ